MINRLNTNRVNQIGRRADRRAFTLVELLIVMVVIAILSSMVIMALTNAGASAKDVHTRATITKLHDLIMQKYESYQTRRVPLAITGATRLVKAQNRLNALRDLMRMEMPDRLNDLTSAPITGLAVPSTTKYYRSRVPSSPNSQFESAECLYMIIAYGLQDQEALERFSESEIGDVDGDGMSEFIDAWGKPIAFLRWAPMFPSEAQFPTDSRIPNLRATYPPVTADLNLLAQYNHDPFDPLKRDASAFAIYPLIYSAGPDRIFDIETGRTTANQPFAAPIEAGTTKDLASEFGAANTEENWTDNITNHELLVP